MRAIFFSLLGVLAVGDGQTLVPAGRTMPVPVDSYVQNFQVFWSRGFAIYSSDDTGSITVYDTSGQGPLVASQVKIWPDKTSELRIVHAAASGDGTFAVSGAAYASTGESTGFLAFFGKGAPVKLIQLPTTALFRIAFADDGTVWAIAREVDSTLQDLPLYNTLRHYDTNGKLLGSTLPNTMFPGKGSAMYSPSLSIAAGTIGVYLDRAKTWVELTLDGSLKGTWTVPAQVVSSGQRPHSGLIYLTDSGRIARLSWTTGKQPADSTSTIEYMTKAGASLASTPINVSSALSSQVFFHGFTGEQLVWESKGTLTWGSIQ